MNIKVKENQKQLIYVWMGKNIDLKKFWNFNI